MLISIRQLGFKYWDSAGRISTKPNTKQTPHTDSVWGVSYSTLFFNVLQINNLLVIQLNCHLRTVGEGVHPGINDVAVAGLVLRLVRSRAQLVLDGFGGIAQLDGLCDFEGRRLHCLGLFRIGDGLHERTIFTVLAGERDGDATVALDPTQRLVSVAGNAAT